MICEGDVCYQDLLESGDSKPDVLLFFPLQQHPEGDWWSGYENERCPMFQNTLPETNSKFAPENRPGPKRKLVFQPSIFRGYVSFREGMFFHSSKKSDHIGPTNERTPKKPEDI